MELTATDEIFTLSVRNSLERPNEGFFIRAEFQNEASGGTRLLAVLSAMKRLAEILNKAGITPEELATLLANSQAFRIPQDDFEEGKPVHIEPIIAEGSLSPCDDPDCSRCHPSKSHLN